MTRKTKTVLLVATLLMLMTTLLVAGCAKGVDHTWTRLKVSVEPIYQGEPGSIVVLAKVEPRPEHRTLFIGIEGPKSGQSRIDLHGDRADRFHWFRMGNLPNGEYVGYAAVEDQSNKVIAEERVTFRVTE